MPKTNTMLYVDYISIFLNCLLCYPLAQINMLVKSVAGTHVILT